MIPSQPSSPEANDQQRAYELLVAITRHGRGRDCESHDCATVKLQSVADMLAEVRAEQAASDTAQREALREFFTKLAESQTELPPECARILRENLWDLYA